MHFYQTAFVSLRRALTYLGNIPIFRKNLNLHFSKKSPTHSLLFFSLFLSVSLLCFFLSLSHILSLSVLLSHTHIHSNSYTQTRRDSQKDTHKHTHLSFFKILLPCNKIMSRQTTFQEGNSCFSLCLFTKPIFTTIDKQINVIIVIGSVQNVVMLMFNEQLVVWVITGTDNPQYRLFLYLSLQYCQSPHNTIQNFDIFIPQFLDKCQLRYVHKYNSMLVPCHKMCPDRCVNKFSYVNQIMSIWKSPI